MIRTTNFKGSPLEVLGKEIKVADKLPEFVLTNAGMADTTNADFAGKSLIILTVPSLDTPVCSIEVKKFSEKIAGLGDKVTVLTVSRDLPFAQKRWCGAEGVENITTASDYKHRDFAEKFGVLIKDWQVLSRAVFVVGKDGVVKYVEYVSEISEEPNYEAALGAC